MAKDNKTPVVTRDIAVAGQKTSVVPRQRTPRAMSLERARKLIAKTSAEHQGLFRRLAK
jgi:hypothetical protein